MTLRVSRCGAGVCIASLGLIALVAPAAAEPSQRDASITQDAKASGLRLATSEFFADNTAGLNQLYSFFDFMGFYAQSIQPSVQIKVHIDFLFCPHGYQSF